MTSAAKSDEKVETRRTNTAQSRGSLFMVIFIQHLIRMMSIANLNTLGSSSEKIIITLNFVMQMVQARLVIDYEIH